ncbi:MAG: FAD-binding protein [Desulfovibrionaceae bacterium]|nr:FAD-binding protein [Desulfovibrionaceae bacterium]MBF0512618.1 FAD-binding protein [Desulfovibrionaceae bacterium]
MQGPVSLTARQLSFLENLFPGDALLTTPEETLIFATDASRRRGRADAVARPETADQVKELFAFASAEKIPLTIRSRATNVAGCCVPDRGGVVVATSRLDTILEISEADSLAVCQPGVVTGDLQAAVAARRLFYPPDAASAAFSSIGGNAATNAGGLRAVKYGVTRNYVLGFSCVLPDGSHIVTGARTHKNAAGLDLTSLLVGSEGTLAFFTEIILKLLPLPEATASLLVCFDSLDTAIKAAYAVLGRGLLPAAMEIMAEEVLAALAAVAPAPWSGAPKAALLLQFDGLKATAAAEAAAAQQAIEPFRPASILAALTPADEDKLWAPRRLVNQASFALGPDKISDDVTLPRGKVAEAMARFRRIASDLHLRVLLFGHLGDGNIHVNYMFDAADPAQAANAALARDATLAATLELSGSITGEHGVGLAKVFWLEKQYGRREIELMRALKRCFDPAGILNPGKGY